MNKIAENSSNIKKVGNIIQFPVKPQVQPINVQNYFFSTPNEFEGIKFYQCNSRLSEYFFNLSKQLVIGVLSTDSGNSGELFLCRKNTELFVTQLFERNNRFYFEGYNQTLKGDFTILGRIVCFGEIDDQQIHFKRCA